MPNPSWPRSSLPTSASPTPGERTYPEVARGDEYPEVITEPQLNPYAYNTQQSPSILGEKEKYDPARSRVGSYKILGLRSWVLVVLVCVVAISVALAVGLAIGLPASKRSNGSMYVSSMFHLNVKFSYWTFWFLAIPLPNFLPPTPWQPPLLQTASPSSGPQRQVFRPLQALPQSQPRVL